MAGPREANDAQDAGRGVGKRDDILRAAHALFARQGFKKTSIRDIATEADVAVATIYSHFGDKLGVLEALVDVRLDAILREMASLTAIEDPVDRFVAGVEALNRGTMGDPLLRRLVARNVGDFDRRLLERAEQVEGWFDELGTAALEDLVGSGRLRIEDTGALVAILRCVFQGWATTEAARADGVSVRAGPRRRHDPAPQQHPARRGLAGDPPEIAGTSGLVLLE